MINICHATSPVYTMHHWIADEKSCTHKLYITISVPRQLSLDCTLTSLWQPLLIFKSHMQACFQAPLNTLGTSSWNPYPLPGSEVFQVYFFAVCLISYCSCLCYSIHIQRSAVYFRGILESLKSVREVSIKVSVVDLPGFDSTSFACALL